MSDSVTITGSFVVPNFTGGRPGFAEAQSFAFNNLFGNGQSSNFYNGTGAVPAATTSPNGTLVITSGTLTNVPTGYVAVYDETSGDVVNGTGSISYFLTDNGAGKGSILNLDGGSNMVWAMGEDTINAGAGATTIASGVHGATVAGGAGAFEFFGGTGAVSVDGGGGSVTLFGGTGSAQTLLVGGSGKSILLGGSGTGNTTLIGGSGYTEEFAVGSGATTLVAGTGTSQLVGMYGTGNELFTTSPIGNLGKSVMGLNNAADTVIGGSGESTVVGGLGHDIYGFINGHAGGSEVIIGLKATDVVAFGGYGVNPIALESVKNGSDVVTLVDGTSITFEGYNHKIFS